MSTLTETAPAKINLALRVVGRRPDGYHAIESVVAFCPHVCDVIRLTPETATTVTVVGPFAEAIAGENLISTTLARLAELEPRLSLGSVTLEKNLPVAAGIGGGSADAAALLRAVRRSNPAVQDALDWQALALTLGADVPVCLESAPAFMWGIGERMVPLKAFPQLHAVLVNPMSSAPPDKTAQVFARLAAPSTDDLGPPPNAPGPFANTEELVAFVERIGNDLNDAAAQVVPESQTVLAELKSATGCLYAGLSGAGPTCFGIFASAAQAAASAGALGAARPDWWIADCTIR